jgi:hypothetical protein
MLGCDGRVLDDQVRLRGIVPDDQLARRSGKLPARHQHEADGGMRDRNLRLADRKRRLQIEGYRLTRRNGPPCTSGWALAIVDEGEHAVSLVHDARMVRGDAGRCEDDVAIGRATNDDRLLAEPRNHRRQEVITPEGECRVSLELPWGLEPPPDDDADQDQSHDRDSQSNGDAPTARRRARVRSRAGVGDR